MENLELLVNQLLKYENETNWFEFKCNNYDPEMIGQDISALANGAAYAEKSCAYMIWGIDDKSHDIVGTELDQYSKLVGNQEIENTCKLPFIVSSDVICVILYLQLIRERLRVHVCADAAIRAHAELRLFISLSICDSRDYLHINMLCQ